MLAPALVRVLVIDPAAHSAQSLASSEPSVSTYRPASQSMHADASDAVEYLPTPHAVHVVAPLLLPASVIDPAAHAMHESTFDAAEYSPAAHSVHERAPAIVPVSVIEPAWHPSQRGGGQFAPWLSWR